MTKLHISPDIAIPPDVVTATTVVYGGKGMGKTNLGSVLVEELTKARLRWCVLDPMGVWWGLRHSKDGKSPGIQCVILGGAHGDIPIEPTGGAIVADLVVDERVNTIIDFSRRANGKMWSKGERIRFVTDYTTRLFERQGELVGNRRREPMIQILDEAARYIPQQIPANSPMLAECVGAWEQVCEEGRNIGLGVAFLTQRSARMNKSVSELADVMFAFRTVGPNSLAAVMDWLGEHVEKTKVRDLAAAVRELNVGQALVVSPGWLKTEKIATIRERETFDSSATPKPGQQQRRVTGKAAKPDLASYEAKMAATIENAKASDPKEMAKTIADLRRQLAAKPSAAPAPKVDVRAQINDAVERAAAGFQKEEYRRMRLISTEVRKTASLLDGASARLRDVSDQIDKAPPPIHPITLHPVVAQASASTPKSVTTTPIDRPQRQRDASDALNKGSQRILDTMAEMEAIGITTTTRAQVGMIAGYNLNGGTGGQNMADLIAAGYIASPSPGVIHLTPSGRANANAVGVPTSSRELHDRMLAKMSAGQQRIARYLISIHPNSISRADLGRAIDYNLNGGTGGQNVADLIAMGAVTSPSPGLVVASDLLFPEGLR